MNSIIKFHAFVTMVMKFFRVKYFLSKNNKLDTNKLISIIKKYNTYLIMIVIFF